MPKITRRPQHAVQRIDALVDFAEQVPAPDSAKSATRTADRDSHSKTRDCTVSRDRKEATHFVPLVERRLGAELGPSLEMPALDLVAADSQRCGRW